MFIIHVLLYIRNNTLSSDNPVHLSPTVDPGKAAAAGPAEEDVDLHSGCYVVKNRSDSVLLLSERQLCGEGQPPDSSVVQLLLKQNTNTIVSV